MNEMDEEHFGTNMTDDMLGTVFTYRFHLGQNTTEYRGASEKQRLAPCATTPYIH